MRERGEARKPPNPHYRAAVNPGTCRWCGQPAVSDKTGKPVTWHPECVAESRLMLHAQAMRSHVYQRDKGFCAGCGVHYSDVPPLWRPDTEVGPAPWNRDGPHSLVMVRDASAVPVVAVVEWHADHIVPLHEVDQSLPWEAIRRYWLPENVQTLCVRCHAAKTASEARRRAMRRAA